MNMSDEQLERYARHIVLKEIGGGGQRKLLDAHAAVIGAGGVSSPVIQYLAAAGVGRITLIDDDIVSLSNLQRQVIYTTNDIRDSKVLAASSAIGRLNPDVVMVPIACHLDANNAAELLENADVVVDGCDSFVTRLAVSDATIATKVPLVSAAIGPFEGQLGVYRGWEPDKPCYRCFVGDRNEDPGRTCADEGVLGAMAGAVGCMAAIEAIRQIVPFGVETAGTILLMDALSFRFRSISLPKDASCACSR